MDYQVSVDKFVFRVDPACRYSEADVWAIRDASRVRIGLTDFLQQKSGDAAFVHLRENRTVLAANDEVAALETIKVDVVVPAPLAGKIVAVNSALADHPELINSDPYGEGWLVELEPTDMADFDAMLDADTYLPKLQTRAEQEQRQ